MKKFKSIIFGVSFLLCGFSAFAQWEKTGPDGGIVYDVVVNGSEWLCRTNGGIYKSTDNGENWTDVNNGLPYGPTISLIRHGSEYYLTTKSGNFYTSADGESWTLKGNNVFKFTYSNAGTLYGVHWPTPSNNIVTTTDGTTYGGLSTINEPTGALAHDGTYLWAGTTGGVRYRNITNNTWASISFSGMGSTNDLKSFPSGLFSASTTGIFRHTGSFYDNNWANVSTSLPANAEYSCLAYANGKTYVVGKRNGLFTIYSSADGSNWSEAFAFGKNKIFALKVSGSDLIACTAYGLYVSTDGAQTWNLKVNNIKAHFISDIVSTTSAIYASVVYKDFMTSTSTTFTLGGTIFKSTDNGTTWNKTGMNDTIGVLDLLVAGDKLFAIGRHYSLIGNNYLLFRSSDGGDNWQALSEQTRYVSTMLYRNNTLYIGGVVDEALMANIATSTDFGDTWTFASPGYSIMSNVQDLVATSSAMFVHNSLYFSVQGGGVSKSTDNAANWALTNNDYRQGFESSGPIDRLGSDGSALYASVFNYFFGNYAEYRYSTDNGATWKKTNTYLPPHRVNSFHGWEGNTYMGTGLDGGWFGTVGTIADSGAVFMTSDRGANWTDISGDMPEISVTALHVAGDKLYAGTWGAGIWMRQAIAGSITQPAALSTFNPGNVVEFQWEVENVDNVVLEYSSNDGATWSTIVNDLPSDNLKLAATKNGEYSWTVPSISSSQIFVRMKDFDSGIELSRNQYNISTAATAIATNLFFHMNVYPNPSSGVFVIDGKEDYSIEVMNSLGEQVYGIGASGQYFMNLSHLPKGMYTCRLVKEDAATSMKLVIE